MLTRFESLYVCLFHLDLNASGRKSSAANNDSFHIAFGSKIQGVPSASSTGRRSTKEVRLVEIVFAFGIKVLTINGPHHEKMCLRESLTRQDTN